MDALAQPHPAFPVYSLTAQPASGAKESSVSAAPTAPAATAQVNASSVLGAVIDDWLGTDALSERSASIHLALHGIVSAPFLLLDHKLMTAELLHSLPSSVWKALDNLAVEQGNALDSVCFPSGMTDLPKGLSMLGPLAYIELPRYAGKVIELRDLALENRLHLSLRGTRDPVSVHARAPATIVVTGNENTVSLNYHDEKPPCCNGDSPTSAANSGQHDETDGFPAAPPLSAMTTIPVEMAMHQNIPSSCPPCPAEQTGNEGELSAILLTLQNQLNTSMSPPKKMVLLTTPGTGALTKIASVLLTRNDQLVNACLHFLASVSGLYDFKFCMFQNILKSVSEQLRAPPHKSAYYTIAPFVVAKFLDLNIGVHMKFDLLNDKHGNGRGHLGLSSALRKGDHQSIELILAALFKSDLPTEKMVELLDPGEANDSFETAVSCGHTVAVKKWVEAVMACPQLSKDDVRRLLDRCRPAAFKSGMENSWIQTGNTTRTSITFATSILRSNATAEEIDHFLNLTLSSRQSRTVHKTRRKNIGQPFCNLVCLGDNELIRYFVAAVCESRLDDSLIINLLTEGKLPQLSGSTDEPELRPYVDGWRSFAREVFFSKSSDSMKANIIQRSAMQGGEDFSYKDMFLQATVQADDEIEPGIEQLRKGIACSLEKSGNFEQMNSESLDRIVQDLKTVLAVRTLTETVTISMLGPILKKGLSQSTTCVSFTELILDSALSDDAKLNLFRNDNSRSAGLAMSLHSNHDIFSNYLNAVLESRLSGFHKVILLSLTDWTTSKSSVTLFAERILASSLDRESLRLIFLRQTHSSRIYNEEAGAPLLEIVLNSRLSSDEKFQIAGSDTFVSASALPNITTPAYISSYLKLILDSSFSDQQKVLLCEARGLVNQSYLCNLFMELVGKTGQAEMIAACTAKAQAFIEAVIASSLPERHKFELLFARNRLGEPGIEYAEKAGASVTVEMFNQTILNSTLTEAVKKKLVRNGMCPTQ